MFLTSFFKLNTHEFDEVIDLSQENRLKKKTVS